MGSPLRTRPGSTVPPQGGKGGVRPTQPGSPQQPQTPYTPIGTQPQVPAQGGKGPITLPPGVGDAFPTPPGGGYPPMQPTVPAQGGKAPIKLPRGVGDAFPIPQVPYGSVQEQNDAAARDRAARGIAGQGNDMRDLMPYGGGGGNQPAPGQVPAQGGKAPLTPEQQAALGPYINNRPMPQVSPPQGGFPQQPGMNPYEGYPQRDLGYGIPPPRPQVFPAQPQVMPRPVPQVMPRQPAPKPAPQGLAQIQQMLQQQQMLRGRR